MATHVHTGAAHHVRLTVTDRARSREFYGLLGFQAAMEFPDGVLASKGTLRLGLRTGPDAARARRDDRFDPNRVGLDHLAISVGSRADIEAAARLCDERGVKHGEIVDLGSNFQAVRDDAGRPGRHPARIDGTAALSADAARRTSSLCPSIQG